METVIITAATIAIVIPASLWTGSLTALFTRYENIEIKNAYVTYSEGKYVVTVEYVNTGSSPTSIDSVLLNGVPYSSYMPPVSLEKDFSTLPPICEAGAPKSGKIIIPHGATDPSGNGLTDGVALIVTLHTTGSKIYPTSVTLIGGGSGSSTMNESLQVTCASDNSSIEITQDNSIFTQENNNSTTSSYNATYPEIIVTVDYNRVIGRNNLSLGFMLECWEWKSWRDSPARRELARNANFKLIRLFDFKPGSPQPCIYWEESTKTGIWNWTDVDLLVQRIFEIGAEPMFCLGASGDHGPRIVPGMAVNPDTNLPYPESFARYASEWVRHFKKVRLPVRFYEIWNEPWTYFGWEPINFTKLSYYMQLFNTVTASMRQENSELLISFDFIIRKPVLDFWLVNGGADVDSLNFHKYGYWIAGGRTDAEELTLAESEYFGKWPMGYTLKEAQQLWLKIRGKLLPLINSESNFNSAWMNGTDPRIQQMVGAVWIALVLRMDILHGVNYNVYYSFGSSASYGKNTPTAGAGFGMINDDNNQPWYPYYVQYIIGNNLEIGDSIVDSTSSSDNIRSLAWIHNGILNVLLIHKSNQSTVIQLHGLEGRLQYTKIDNSISWESPQLQTGAINSTDKLVMNGYAIILLQIG